MQQAFLIIIAAVGAIYAFFTRQMKLGLGLFVIAAAFVFTIPDLVFGIWENVFGALAMILFALGVVTLVYRKKPKVTNEETDQEAGND